MALFVGELIHVRIMSPLTGDEIAHANILPYAQDNIPFLFPAHIASEVDCFNNTTHGSELQFFCAPHHKWNFLIPGSTTILKPSDSVLGLVKRDTEGRPSITLDVVKIRT
jgi:hypothetical protein